MSQLVSRSVLATALLFGALGCSDSTSDSTNPVGSNAGTGGTQGEMNTTAGTGGMGGTEMAMEGTGGTGAGMAGSGGSNMATAGSGGADMTGGVDAGVAVVTSDAGFPTADKLVALTFDDGPSNVETNAVLDKLEFYDVPASFFLIGQNVNAGTQAVLQRAADLGCEFENHSDGYGSMDGLNQGEIEASIDATNAAILQFTNTTPEFFRPPNLATSALMYQVIDLPFAQGIVGGDFPGAVNTVDGVSAAVLDSVQDGSIILLHDVQQAPHPTPDALDIIIPELKERGYEMVTLRQLFARQGVDPASLQGQNWNVVPAAN